MRSSELPAKEAAIIARLGAGDQPSLSAEAARGVLAIAFGLSDKRRMDTLAAKARHGTLTPDEEAEAEAYTRVGSLLGILKSKARQTLKARNGSRHTTKSH
jgi:hypothetical protein